MTIYVQVAAIDIYMPSPRRPDVLEGLIERPIAFALHTGIQRRKLRTRLLEQIRWREGQIGGFSRCRLTCTRLTSPAVSGNCRLPVSVNAYGKAEVGQDAGQASTAPAANFQNIADSTDGVYACRPYNWVGIRTRDSETCEKVNFEREPHW